MEPVFAAAWGRWLYKDCTGAAVNGKQGGVKRRLAVNMGQESLFRAERNAVGLKGRLCALYVAGIDDNQAQIKKYRFYGIPKFFTFL